MTQQELDLWNPTPEQKVLDDLRIALSKKRSMKQATKYTAFVLMTSRLKGELHDAHISS